MPYIKGIALPEYVSFAGAIVNEAHERHLMCTACEPYDKMFTRLIAEDLDGPAKITTDTTISVVISYGAGIRQHHIEPFIGRPVNMRCRVAVTVDQKRFTRKVRLYVQDIARQDITQS